MKSLFLQIGLMNILWLNKMEMKKMKKSLKRILMYLNKSKSPITNFLNQLIIKETIKINPQIKNESQLKKILFIF
jgi:hypothetical protein